MIAFYIMRFFILLHNDLFSWLSVGKPSGREIIRFHLMIAKAICGKNLVPGAADSTIPIYLFKLAVMQQGGRAHTFVSYAKLALSPVLWSQDISLVAKTSSTEIRAREERSIKRHLSGRPFKSNSS